MPQSDLREQLQEALGDAYAIGRELGGGGMSRVFLATESALGRRVVIKILPPELGADVSVERFRREIQLVAQLHHPHVVPVLATGQAGDLLYYTMPYIEGESLRARLEQQGELPVPQGVRLLKDVADALAAAHRRGIVHRDIKPDNVLMAEGHALVTDFGIAKALSVSAAGEVPTGLTSGGVAIGTPAYMAPEQAAGDSATDHRADLYSLGVLAYEVFTGQPPFTGRPAQALLFAHATEPPEAVNTRRPAMPAMLADLIMRLLAKRPADRPQSAEEVLSLLEGMTTPGSVQSITGEARLSGTSSGSREIAPLRSRTSRYLFGAAATALVLAGAGWAFRDELTGSQSQTERPRLAVLPFENLGRPDDEYFADGITDEITGRLARMSQLGVIARTSAAQYKATDKTLKQIGKELDVDYVLQGTVRFNRTSGGQSRVRVNPQLARVSDGRAVWAGEQFDGELADVFAVQTSVAERVAQALDVTLLAGERKALSARPTDNLAAYDYYLRGGTYSTRPMRYVADARRKAVEMYEQAVKLDPAFALAWARLAVAYIYLWERGERTTERVAQAKAAADRAFALDSMSPDSRLAMGMQYLMASNDNPRAMDQFVIGLRSHPDNIDLLYALGEAQQIQGRFQEALTTLTRATALDPRSPHGPAEIAETQDFMRNYPEAIRVRERELALTPNNVGAYYAQAYSHLNSRGDTASARRVLRRGVQAVGLSRMLPLSARGASVLWPLLDAAVLRVMDTLSFNPALSTQWTYYAVKAHHSETRGRSELARSYYDSARVALEAHVREQPDDAQLRSALGTVYSALGRKADAIREGRRAVEMEPVSLDVYNGSRHLLGLARTYARVGEPDSAVEKLRVALAASGTVSQYILRLDPAFAPLRNNAKFQRLLASQ